MKPRWFSVLVTVLGAYGLIVLPWFLVRTTNTISSSHVDHSDLWTVSFLSPTTTKRMSSSLTRQEQRRQQSLHRNRRPRAMDDDDDNDRATDNDRSNNPDRTSTSHQQTTHAAIHSNWTLLLQDPTTLSESEWLVSPRIFPKYPYDFPCFKETQLHWRKPPVQDLDHIERGLLFMRPTKAATSTSLSVHLRLAQRQGHRRGYTTIVDEPPSRFGSNEDNVGTCETRNQHGVMRMNFATKFQHRDKTQSFLWSIVRQPTQRYISHFFFDAVSRWGFEATDDNFQQFVNTSYVDYFVNILSTRGYRTHDTDAYDATIPYLTDTVPNRHLYSRRTRSDDRIMSRKRSVLPLMDPIVVANEIMQEYDFIAVTERFDESIVVLTMLLDIPITDVLYLNAKVSGGLDDGNMGVCKKTVKSFVSPVMKTFFASPYWKKRVQYEDLLYQAVNRSLDMTIDYLGRDKVEKRLQEFLDLQDVVTATCADVARPPCIKEKEQPRPLHLTDCIEVDSGCGTPCINSVADAYESAF